MSALYLFYKSSNGRLWHVSDHFLHLARLATAMGAEHHNPDVRGFWFTNQKCWKQTHKSMGFY